MCFSFTPCYFAFIHIKYHIEMSRLAPHAFLGMPSIFMRNRFTFLVSLSSQEFYILSIFTNRKRKEELDSEDEGEDSEVDKRLSDSDSDMEVDQSEETGKSYNVDKASHHASHKTKKTSHDTEHSELYSEQLQRAIFEENFDWLPS